MGRRPPFCVSFCLCLINFTIAHNAAFSVLMALDIVSWILTSGHNPVRPPHRWLNACPITDVAQTVQVLPNAPAIIDTYVPFTGNSQTTVKVAKPTVEQYVVYPRFQVHSCSTGQQYFRAVSRNDIVYCRPSYNSVHRQPGRAIGP